MRRSYLSLERVLRGAYIITGSVFDKFVGGKAKAGI